MAGVSGCAQNVSKAPFKFPTGGRPSTGAGSIASEFAIAEDRISWFCFTQQNVARYSVGSATLRARQGCFTVMAALDAAIHASRSLTQCKILIYVHISGCCDHLRQQCVDGRHKAGHDGWRVGFLENNSERYKSQMSRAIAIAVDRCGIQLIPEIDPWPVMAGLDPAIHASPALFAGMSHNLSYYQKLSCVSQCSLGWPGQARHDEKPKDTRRKGINSRYS